MKPFTIHWSPVPSEAAGKYTADAMQLFALWPSPVNPDVCFHEAGFSDFGDNDVVWDAHAEVLLQHLIGELGKYGEPHLMSKPAVQRLPWYRRLFTKPEPFSLLQQIQLPTQWDSLPDCIVAFGNNGVSLRTGNGHHLFWILLPACDAPKFPQILQRLRGTHPIVRTGLKWGHLLGSALH